MGQLCEVIDWDSQGEYFQLAYTEWVVRHTSIWLPDSQMVPQKGARAGQHEFDSDCFDEADAHLLRKFIFPEDLSLVPARNKSLLQQLHEHFAPPTVAAVSAASPTGRRRGAARGTKVPQLMGASLACSMYEVMAAGALSTVRMEGLCHSVSLSKDSIGVC